ncbi:putative uncharacterized protein [Ruminococcus sp. CAG:403]|nr:putative uncharacterized protein [Ruminococcus sp. CAG:403]
MEQKAYQPGQAQNRPRRPAGPMGRPSSGEKAKDLVGTWKKLLRYCRKYIAILITAVVCAAVGVILTLAGPDQLSNMTDTITKGIAPNTEKLETITTTLSDSISSNMETLMQEITAPLSDETIMQQKTAAILEDSNCSAADKQAFQDFLNAASDPDSMQEQLLTLPNSVQSILFSDIENQGVTISVEDQIQTLQLLGTLHEEDAEALQQALGQLPESVTTVLYTDLQIDGVTITGADQSAMMTLLSGMDSDDTDAILAALDQLPDSVYGLIKPTIDMERILQIGLLLVTFYLLSYILSTTQGFLMATVTQRVSKQMRSDISRKINRLPMWFYNRTTTGDVLSRVTNDVDTIGQSLNQSIGTLVSAVVLFLGSLIMMLVTNVWMTVTAVLASVLGFSIMLAITSRSQKYFIRQQQHLGDLNGHIEEIYTGHTVVKAYNGEAEAEQTFDQMNQKLCESNFKAQCLSGMMMPVMNFIGNLGYVAVCVVGGAMALNGKITFGVIVAFMMYVRYFTQPLSQIAQAVQSLQSAGAAGERVFEFLEAEEMEDETGKIEQLSNVKGEVTFEHVKFGYEDSDATIIHDFSAVAKPGQKVAIVGPTGAGKTTMVNLLMRFHEIQGGKICIDGTPTNTMKREAVHAQFCMVLQDTWLFEGTVRENLIYCEKGIREEKMRAACKAVGLDHFIRTLPNGYDTVLNDQVNLSQGQKQQLTIARAMIADKPMLILDEATSSIDTRTERQIQTAMDQLMEGRTSFVIAHRLSTIKNADLILVLKDGDIIESGTHEELIAKNGFYADLYNSQFEQVS